MTVFEILLIAAALSLDAFSVCLSAGMVYTGITRRQSLSMPVAFGIFQGIMPVAGFFLGYMFESVITKWQGPISLIILGVIGLNMIFESVFKKQDAEHKELTAVSLITLAIATSIDAFAVGVSFAAMEMSRVFDGTLGNIYSSALMIAATTFVLCMIAILLGKRVGQRLGDKAEIVGGAVLILIGLKNLLF